MALHEKSIAVLPFVNMSPDTDNEYFSDGITEEIINALTAIKNLKVTARTSSFAFKGRATDIRNIGQQLGVITVLEGSVRKAGNRVRITAQLVRTDDGFQLWSRSFDRDLEDIFAVQDEISLSIADQIRENFGHLEFSDQLIKSPNVSVDIYERYLEGRYFFHRFNAMDVKRGLSLLEDLARKHPQFALAKVGVQYGYNMMAAAGLLPARESLAKGKPFLDEALAIDEKLPECHHSLGWHSLNQDWDFMQAARHLKRAIELRPGYADAYQKLFITLALEGKLEEAHLQIQKALQLDPLAPLNNYFISYSYYLAEDFALSNQHFEHTFELEPSFLIGYSIYGLSLVLQDRPAYLLKKAESIASISGSEVERLLMKTLALSKMGDWPETEACIEQLEDYLEGVSRERVRFFLIYIESILGRIDKALHHVEQGVRFREPLMTLLKVDPLLKTTALVEERRYQDLLKTIYLKSDTQVVATETSEGGPFTLAEIDHFTQQLDAVMLKDKPYLNPALSLRALADTLELHPNKLSWLINESIGQNFNTYINTFRLEAFKTLAKDPRNQHLTLLGLAYDSGFNSKTVFNSYFKKVEGMTPRVWLKQNPS